MGTAKSAGAARPKFLLDTNVFRSLADGELREFEERLLKIGNLRLTGQPVWWTCPTVCMEILCHIRPEEADRFDHFREALLWMEKLCGNVGMAEDFPWALACGLFAELGPSEDGSVVLFNQIRRKFLKAGTLAEVTTQMSESQRALRAAFEERIVEWKREHAHALERMRELAPLPVTEEDVLTAITEAIVSAARRHQEPRVSSWGKMRSREDQKTAMREVIAFRISRYLQARQHPNYSVKTNDHNDGWLCPYPAAGFVLVTGDGKLKKALLSAGCEDPRVMELPEALDAAEKALARSDACIDSGQADAGR
jgi:hypothetical protein